MLSIFARLAGADWRTQARRAPADVIWSGDMHAPKADRIFESGSTLINLIGYTGPDEARLQVDNVTFVQTLLAKAADTGVAHVILASSAATYGAGGDAPFLETDPLTPLTAYGASKAAMERAALKFAKQSGTPAITIARIGSVAGADSLTAAAKRHVAAGTTLQLHRFKDGTTPLRPYIGPRDLFVALNALCAPHGGAARIINVVHPVPVTLESVLTAYRTHTMPDLKWSHTPAPPDIPPRITMSSNALQQLVKLDEYGDPADALGRQVAEYLAQ